MRRRRRAVVVLGFIAIGAVVGFFLMPGQVWTPRGVLSIRARPLFLGDAAPLRHHLGVLDGGEFGFAYRGPPAVLQYAREMWEDGALVRGPDWTEIIRGSRFGTRLSFSLTETERDRGEAQLRLVLAVEQRVSEHGGPAFAPHEEWVDKPPEPRDMFQWRSGVRAGRLEIGEGNSHMLWGWIGAGVGRSIPMDFTRDLGTSPWALLLKVRLVAEGSAEDIHR